MGHIVLYRKYRPNTFSKIVGQEHVTKILKNQIVNDKVGHAYIFSGTRGTGKTSAAKVFARAINCLNPQDGEPCNECENCKAILNGETSDVVEMDAASNNGVDSIREIRQEVIYASTFLKYRVYIIDEVHMLSTAAFNALLKTLEEPPKGVIFILATTELHKIPITILSRCLKFEFKTISEEDIANNIKNILKQENREYEEEAVRYISRLADGGMRDALSIVDRCLDEGEVLKLENIESLAGSINNEVLKNILLSIITYKPYNVLKLADNLIQSGKNIRQINYEIINEFMNLMIKITTQNEVGHSVFKDEEINDIQRYLVEDRLNYIITKLNILDNDIRMSSNPQVIFKSRLIELSSVKRVENVVKSFEEKSEIVSAENKDYMPLINDLTERIRELEEEIDELKEKGVTLSTKSTKDAVETVDNKPKLKEFRDFKKLQNEIKNKKEMQLYSSLVISKAYVDKDIIYFVTENSFVKSMLEESKSKELLEDTILEITGKDYDIRIVENKKENEEDDLFEQRLNEIDMDYEEI